VLDVRGPYLLSALEKVFTSSGCYRAFVAILSCVAFLLLVPADAVGQGQTADFSGRCLVCHGQEYLGRVAVEGQTKNLYIDPELYEETAHGLLPCNSCHIGFSTDPHSMVSNAESFAEMAREACRNCHDDQYEMYLQSYHGTLTREYAEAPRPAEEKPPVCVDCHGTHAIHKVGGLEYKQNIHLVCGKCHKGSDRTYLDTYHGKAVNLGRQAAATCVDCHGSHSILPPSNPESTLSEANALETCRLCHPKASEGFTTYLVHITPTSPSAPLVVFLVAVFYLALIILVFSFGGVHTLLYIYRGLKDKLYFGKGEH